VSLQSKGDVGGGCPQVALPLGLPLPVLLGVPLKPPFLKPVCLF